MMKEEEKTAGMGQRGYRGKGKVSFFQLIKALSHTLRSTLLGTLYLMVINLHFLVFQLNSWMVLCLRAIWMIEINPRHL